MKLISRTAWYLSLVCVGVFLFGGIKNHEISYFIAPALLLALFGTLQDLEKPKEKLFENLNTAWIHQPHVDQRNPLNWLKWYGVQFVMCNLIFGLPAYIVGRLVGVFA